MTVNLESSLRPPNLASHLIRLRFERTLPPQVGRIFGKFLRSVLIVHLSHFRTSRRLPSFPSFLSQSTAQRGSRQAPVHLPNPGASSVFDHYPISSSHTLPWTASAMLLNDSPRSENTDDILATAFSFGGAGPVGHLRVVAVERCGAVNFAAVARPKVVEAGEGTQ